MWHAFWFSFYFVILHTNLYYSTTWDNTQYYWTGCATTKPYYILYTCVSHSANKSGKFFLFNVYYKRSFMPFISRWNDAKNEQYWMAFCLCIICTYTNVFNSVERGKKNKLTIFQPQKIENRREEKKWKWECEEERGIARKWRNKIFQVMNKCQNYSVRQLREEKKKQPANNGRAGARMNMVSWSNRERYAELQMKQNIVTNARTGDENLCEIIRLLKNSRVL